MDGSPLISVVVPAWREERLISACLASVTAQKGSGVSFELLVVDGGSDDGTVERALAFPEVDLRVAPRGKGKQMNAGAEAARGRWILFLPADTRLAPGALGGVSEEHALPDVDLGRRLRRLGRTRVLHHLPVVTSARRFQRHGPLRTMATAAWILGWERLTGRVPRSRVFFTDER